MRKVEMRNIWELDLLIADISYSPSMNSTNWKEIVVFGTKTKQV